MLIIVKGGKKRHRRASLSEVREKREEHNAKQTTETNAQWREAETRLTPKDFGREQDRKMADVMNDDAANRERLSKITRTPWREREEKRYKTWQEKPQE